VEDNTDLLTDLVEFLGLRGFVAQGFTAAEAFFGVWPATHFDLLLLDVALPGASGLEIAQQVRAQSASAGKTVPGMVMLTALDSNDDYVLGLNAGADMYLSKRSSLEVIEAACHSVLRRLDQAKPAASDAWRLQARLWQLQTPNGAVLDLTHAEVLLLSSLFEKPGQAVMRKELLTRMDKAETLSSIRNLDNTASRLRRKVQAACGIELPVRPSYGKGYTFTGHCKMEA
jgi:DNA-binding response OmpR family regulator